jgi:hypothetical protein
MEAVVAVAALALLAKIQHSKIEEEMVAMVFHLLLTIPLLLVAAVAAVAYIMAQ